MLYLKQSTASQTVLIGPFIDKDDGFTAMTALTVNAADIRLSANGGNMFPKTSGGGTHDEEGFYSITLDATDTATVGHLQISVQDATTHLPVYHEATVLEEAVYDDMFAAAAVGYPTAAEVADAVLDEAIEDHDTQGNVGWAIALSTYMGQYGPGIYIDDAAANTNTVVGTDGTSINPVSTFVAARTIADAIGVRTYYMTASDLTLAATHQNWHFVGEGEVTANIVNLGSQDVDGSRFDGLTLEGTQGGAARIEAIDCAIRDPGAGDTTLHVFGLRCGFVDRFQVDTSADNFFDSCYSMVAGSGTPVIDATGAAGTINIRHYSGGIEFESLSASHNVSVETDGNVIFNADCNVAATVVIRGNTTIVDNTAGMVSLTQTAAVNMDKINTEADTAISDAALATAAALTTAQNDLDIITGADGVNLLSGTQTSITNIEADTNELQVDDVPGLIAALNNLSAAAVATEISDALRVDTLTATPQGAPSTTPTVQQALMVLYDALVHAVDVTATSKQFKNDGGTVIWKKALSDDATTYTEAESATGP